MGRVLGIFLSVINISHLMKRKQRFKSKPLVHFEGGFKYLKFIIRVRRHKLQRPGYMFPLKDGIIGKLIKELQEIFIRRFQRRVLLDSCEHP